MSEPAPMRLSSTQNTISIKEYLMLDQKNLTSMGIKMTDLRILNYLNSHDDDPFEKIQAGGISKDLKFDRRWVFRSIKWLESNYYIGRHDAKVSSGARYEAIFTLI